MRPRLTILTYNVGLLRVRVFGASVSEPVPFVDERLRHLPSILRSTDADIISLQEIYEEADRIWLSRQLADLYPYTAWIQDDTRLRVSNGLMILSRFPIEKTRFERYPDGVRSERWFGNKGFLQCVIGTQFGLLNVFNTHAAAGGLYGHPESAQHEELRARQFRYLLTFVDPRGSRALIAGDFNAGPQASPNNYWILAESLVDAYFVADKRAGPNVTWDPANPLNVGGPHKTSPPQRIDHVLLTPSTAELFNGIDVRVAFDQAVVQTRSEQLVTPSDHYGLLVHFFYT